MGGTCRNSRAYPKKDMSDIAQPSKDEERLIRTQTQKVRKCLLCSTDFESEWAGERVCKKCKATAAWRQG